MLLYLRDREGEKRVELQPADLKLRAGSSRHDVGGTLHWVTQVITHHLYDPEVYDYDIALLKVCEFEMTVFLSPLYFCVHFVCYGVMPLRILGLILEIAEIFLFPFPLYIFLVNTTWQGGPG